MRELYVFLTILVVAGVTLLVRMAPFLLFGGRWELPKAVRYLGSVLPPAIMATLVVCCVKGITFAEMSGWMPTVIGVAVTAGLHLWRKNTLLSIAGGTIVYMILLQHIF